MNEEEAIERIKKLIKWFEKWDDDYTLVPCDKVYFETVLNLIEKQQEEIEQLQKEAGYKKCILCGKIYKPNKKDQLYCSKSCCNKVMCKRYKLRKKQEIEKQDKLINLMAEQLTTPVHSKEWVIEHFNQKIEKGE